MAEGVVLSPPSSTVGILKKLGDRGVPFIVSVGPSKSVVITDLVKMVNTTEVTFLAKVN